MRVLPEDQIAGDQIKIALVLCRTGKQRSNMWVRVEQNDCFVDLNQSRMSLPFYLWHASRV